MFRQPIFFQPIFQEKIWGGRKLKDLYQYNIPNDRTGEAWAIAAHKNGQSKVKSGPLHGETLAAIWREYPELFGVNTSSEFPLLVKIIDAHEDLSVQVHPYDTYARMVEGELFGKTECWYILDCEPGSEIVYGHHAKSKDEFMQKVSEGNWDQLLRKIPVKKGDFFYVPSGTIHAIGAGIVLLEIQQNSDTTYRVYDYYRKDADGNLRTLHLEAALDVTIFPHRSPQTSPFITKVNNLIIKRLIKSSDFTVYYWAITGKTTTPLKTDYLLTSVIEGKGFVVIDGVNFPVKKGDHFIIPKLVTEYELNGEMELVVAHR